MASHIGGDDGWAQQLRAVLEAVPLAVTLEEALAPLSAVLDVDSGRQLDVERLRALVRGKRSGMRAILRREGCPDYSEDFALAIFLYTVEIPKLYAVINGQLRSPDRGGGAGGVSVGLRACLPYIKYLREALLNAPPHMTFEGRCHRGIKWAFPSPQDHNPAAFFYPGREFWWFEFKSSSEDFGTMYQVWFCGVSGPRTIFCIEGVRGVRISAFSAIDSEKEVLFPPLTQFKVVRVQKKLRPEDLRPGCAAGGFPDEVQLEPSSEARLITEGVPRDLKLKPGLEVLEPGPPLGSGAFADVLRGTYPLPGQLGPTLLAFKVFRNSHALAPGLREQILREARLGLRLDHPNLIQLFGVLEIPAHGLALVLELADGGSLRTVLDDVAAHPALSWAMRLQWMLGIARGVAKLHR
jgi:hypothetical protein